MHHHRFLDVIDPARGSLWRAATAMFAALVVVLALTSGDSAEARTPGTAVDAVPQVVSATSAVAPHSGLVMNSVQTRASVKGGHYTASVKVRTSQPPVGVTIEVIEQAGGASAKQADSFDLTGTGWQTIAFDFTAQLNGASLGVNVITHGGGGDVEVESSSVASADGSGCAVSARGVPSSCTVVGAAVGGNDDPVVFEGQVGGSLGVRRTYFQSGQVSNAVRVAQADKAAGRVSWISFKLPYTWKEMAAGKGDAWARDLAKRLGAVGGHVWVAFHHEPETDRNQSIGDWVAMQKHLSPVVRGAASNVAFSVIYTGWNQFYGPTQYRMANVWPGDGLVDVVGFDIYNLYGAQSNGKTGTNNVDLAETYLPQITAFTSAHHVAWGLAETGYTDELAAIDPHWFSRSYDQVASAGGVAVSYFNSSLHSTGSWPIDTAAKISDYRRVVAKAPASAETSPTASDGTYDPV